MREFFGGARGKSSFQTVTPAPSHFGQGNEDDFILNATPVSFACYNKYTMKFCSPPPVDFR